MPQNVTPTAVVSAGTWTGAVTDIDEDPLAHNPADFMQSGSAPVNDTLELELSDPTAPGTAVGWQALFVVQKDADGGAQVNAIFEVREGATLRQQWTDVVNVLGPTGGWTTVIKDFTNAAQVVDVTALRLRVIANQP